VNACVALIKLIKNNEEETWRRTHRLIFCTGDPKHLPSDAAAGEWRLQLMLLMLRCRVAVWCRKSVNVTLFHLSASSLDEREYQVRRHCLFVPLTSRPILRYITKSGTRMELMAPPPVSMIF